MRTRARIEFEGIVQGVGFRPFLHKLAEKMQFHGWVLNSSSGVLMELEGERNALEDYVRSVQADGPPLSRVLVARIRFLPCIGYSGFIIKPIQYEDDELTLLCPDVAVCSDCLREINDREDRRYRYAFTNCTNCGPRYSIVKSLPYDRPTTTMASFALCPACSEEYVDVTDRRYHAQPIACAKCGPHLWLEDADGEVLSNDALKEAAQRLISGKIVAIRGLGGFHLACRADMDEVVLTLRQRKQRSFMKPLAVMVPSISIAEDICHIDIASRDWLGSVQAPVVLLPLRSSAVGNAISRYVAPRLDRLGVMLPYTPLHHLLLNDVDHPLVMTSGNLSDEPIIHENEMARAMLLPIADSLLLHDRPIYARCDDSVLAADDAGECSMLRHSRGFSPYPIALKNDGPAVLALGGDLKTTFAASRGHFAFLSPHLGDGEQLATYCFFRETWEHYRKLFNLKPEVIACDMHPGYHTTRWAAELAEELHLPLIKVQHHHAHLVSLQTELGLTGKHTAIVADGTGYGTDGTLWGGEVLYGDAHGFERVAHLRHIMLPGGDGAVREPWRIAMALLHTAAPEYMDEYTTALLDGTLVGNVQTEHPDRVIVDNDPSFAQPSRHDVALVRTMLNSGTSLSPSSSLGRLFNGVAALLGVTTHTSYEGQGPMELEALARPNKEATTLTSTADFLPSASAEEVIDWAPLVRTITTQQRACAEQAFHFHEWAASVLAYRALSHVNVLGDSILLASGGCLQNTLLKGLLRENCNNIGIILLAHREIPAGDGGLALGVLRIAQAQL